MVAAAVAECMKVLRFIGGIIFGILPTGKRCRQQPDWLAAVRPKLRKNVHLGLDLY
jgi:hypothetical protein